MTKAFFKAITILKEFYFWKIAFLCLLITVTLFLIFLGGITYYVQDYFYDWLFDWVISWFGRFLMGYLAYILIPLIYPLVTLIFLDSIASYMERKYYLDADDVREVPISKMIVPTIKFVLFALLLNIILLPFYFIPIVGQILYYWINGYLYGREYFEMIAFRYNDKKELRAIRKANKHKLVLCGIVIVVSFTTPFVNLIAPIFATVFMVHVYHGIRLKNQNNQI